MADPTIEERLAALEGWSSAARVTLQDQAATLARLEAQLEAQAAAPAASLKDERVDALLKRLDDAGIVREAAPEPTP
jgi:hypothetical protein